MQFEYFYLAWIILLSALTFVFYAVDKNLAKNQKRRISEKTLLLLSAFGGGFGGLFAMLLAKHKTKHWYFFAVNLSAVVLHVFALLYFFKVLPTT